MNWNEWKDRPMPSYDKEYHGKEITPEFREGDGRKYPEEYLDEFRYEYETSLDKGLELLDFQGWIVLEEFLGQRVAYETYAKLGRYFSECDIDILSLGEWIAFRKGDSVLWEPYGREGIEDGTSIKCVIEGLSVDDEDLEQDGPKYLIRLPSGQQRVAYYDELQPNR